MDAQRKSFQEVKLSNSKLWGAAGGELEFVSLRLSYLEREDGKLERSVIIRFTDHDAAATATCCPQKDLIEGRYYELELPLAADFGE